MKAGPFDADSSTQKLIIDLLDKYFHENPWCDLSNLDALVKHTGLDDNTIKVIS